LLPARCKTCNRRNSVRSFFGKGLVQRPIDMTYGTAVKATISRYLRHQVDASADYCTKIKMKSS
jgi:hypothetical protein